MVISSGSQPPSLVVVQESPHSYNKRPPFFSFALTTCENHGVRSSVPEMGTEIRYTFLIIDHNITGERASNQGMGIKTREPLREAVRVVRLFFLTQEVILVAYWDLFHLYCRKVGMLRFTSCPVQYLNRNKCGWYQANLSSSLLPRKNNSGWS